MDPKKATVSGLNKVLAPYLKCTVISHSRYTAPRLKVLERGAFDSAKNHKRQRRKRKSVTAKREKSQTPKFV